MVLGERTRGDHAEKGPADRPERFKLPEGAVVVGESAALLSSESTLAPRRRFHGARPNTRGETRVPFTPTRTLLGHLRQFGRGGLQRLTKARTPCIVAGATGEREMLQSIRDKVRLCYERWSSSHRFDIKAEASDGAVASARGHEADLQAIFANTPFLLTRCSSDLRYLFVSEAYARMLGRRPEDFDGRLIVDIMGEEGFRTILPYVERVLRGETVEYESDLQYAGVGPRRVLVKYTPDRDRSGIVRGWIASILDLTDQKKAARMAADLEAMTILREMGSLYVRKGLEPDECRQRTIDAAITIVGADKGNIQLFEAGSNSLVIAAHSGFAEPFLTFFKQVRDDVTACGAAMRTRNQVIVEDVLESDIFVGCELRAVLINAGVRAVVFTPLLSSDGTSMGMISTHYIKPHRLTNRELSLLARISHATN